MDKSNYETYEYLPTSGSENDQFFVVQDNGTFVISRQAVQYTAQVENDKESMETVQVFNVTPQQFLVDVDNSSELISVSDQFIIPDAENLYANSYLLQPGTSTPSEPMDQDPGQNVAVEFKQTDTLNLDIAAQTSKQANSCTEITLTDEQYRMLEQKGWILLEISDKIYVLDTLGLHDITTNEKLIQKLKNEEQNDDGQEIDNGSKLQEGGAFDNNATGINSEQCIIENNVVIEQAAAIETASFTTNNEEETEEENPVYNGVNSETPNVITSSEIKTDSKDCKQKEEDSEMSTRVLVIENEDIRRIGNTLKVKTKLSLKDFPDKISLGKLVNGKNLIAKVIKPSTDNDQLHNDENSTDANSQLLPDNVPAIHLHNNNILNESEFYLLIQHFIQNNITKCTAEDIVTADSIISQLLQIPSFKSSVIDNNLVITKTVQNEDSSGKAINKGLSALVTGRVSLIADQWRFIHLPHMLQEMVTNTEEFLTRNKKEENLNKEDFDILHVQISEAKQAITDVVRVSVTVNKRHIPIHLVTNKPKPQPSTMYACSFCAALFNTELELKDHQTENCVKQEEMLTIDMEQMVKPRDFCVINTGKTKSYACMQCNAKFNRLTTCKNHLKTHYDPKDQDAKEKLQDKSNSSCGIYKCNMCPSTYFHPSTLSKHILARHIKIRS